MSAVEKRYLGHIAEEKPKESLQLFALQGHNASLRLLAGRRQLRLSRSYFSFPNRQH